MNAIAANPDLNLEKSEPKIEGEKKTELQKTAMPGNGRASR